MIGILHTWGRTLVNHLLVYFLVSAGGLDQDGNWLPARKTFLLPVKALSKIFRIKIPSGLAQVALFQGYPFRSSAPSFARHLHVPIRFLSFSLLAFDGGYCYNLFRSTRVFKDFPARCFAYFHIAQLAYRLSSTPDYVAAAVWITEHFVQPCVISILNR
jgi:hypothetical protein